MADWMVLLWSGWLIGVLNVGAVAYYWRWRAKTLKQRLERYRPYARIAWEWGIEPGIHFDPQEAGWA